MIPRRVTTASRWLLLAALAIPVLSGCGTHAVHEKVVDRSGLVIRLRSEKARFGPRVEKGYQHPAVIAPERLARILSGIEVDTRLDDETHERRPAFSAETLEDIALGLSEALEKAGPDEQVVVQSIRKQMQHGIFHRKHLTSFVAYASEDRLHVLLSRVDWPLPDKNEKLSSLPEPWPGESVMDFRTLTGEHYHYAGRQGVRVAWRDAVFGGAAPTPSAAETEARKRTILLESPERMAPVSKTDLEGLSAGQLRALADLEEDRRQGQITETEYRRAREQILDQTR